MLRSIALTTIRAASRVAAPMVSRAPIVQATAARYATARFMSSNKEPFAVDGPDGDHDHQDLEESSAWAKRTIDVASITEDADAITAMHEAVLGKKVFAVDGPDGEHDLEEVEEHLASVNRIIDTASVLENPTEVKDEQARREEIRKKSYNPDASFYNSKY
eukprot:CAMPEP_0183711688 /NCGR_PEP_ID=MMETSP0737-20130205/7134_1 /TAXON_ID=385413 /ORGANISM="Thalassiosira miniscula, Strain CCMP1093" /LENGTH=160 /DNA_ID=CAMNT_0025940255 /DNA_START=138 /DNA_END=620 /DNA_ORIENTATION=+